MADKGKKQPEDRNRMKPGWEITFVAEDILKQSLALWIANNNGELPSEEILHTMTKSCIDGSIFFNQHKKKYGIHDRFTDSVSEEE